MTYIVTVSNQCGVSITDSAVVFLKPLPTVSFIGGGMDCSPVEAIFTDLSTTPVDFITTWLWDFGDGGTDTVKNPIYFYSTPGVYDVTLTVTTAAGCVNDTTIPSLVTVHSDPIAGFTANPLITDLQSPTVSFINQSFDGTSYLWDFADGQTTSLIDPSHTYQDTGTFYVSLVVTNQYGCTNEIITPIVVNPHYTFQVPNAFTPNPNGPSGGQYDPTSLLNDVFYPFADFVQDYHLMIFNRWGELIFESNDIEIGWDGYLNGTLVQQDVYVWKVTITYTDGSEFTKAGDLTLIR